MGMTLAEAWIEIGAKDAGYLRGLQKAKGDTDKVVGAMENRVKRMGEAWKAVGDKMTMYVTLPIVAALGYSVKAAAEAEAQTTKLVSALAKTGEATSRTVADFQRFAEELQSLTVYEDDAIIGMMAFAKNMGVPTAQLKEATVAAIGLADTYNIELNTAFRLVGLAATGNTMMFKRYGIVLKEAKDPVKKFAEVLKIGAAAFDISKAKARSTEGRIEQLKHAFGNLAEKVGAALLPHIKSFAETLISLAKILQLVPEPMLKFSLAMTLAAAAIGPLIRLILLLVKAQKDYALWTAIAQGIANNWKTVALVISGAVVAFYALDKQFGSSAAEIETAMQRQSAAAKTNAAAIETANQRLASSTSQAVDEAKAAAQKQKDLANEAMERERNQAQEVLALAKAKREEASAEMERRRAQIGWTQSSELWKSAMVAGQTNQFAMPRPKGVTVNAGGQMSPNEGFSVAELSRAFREFIRNQSIQIAEERGIREMLNAIKMGNPA